MYDVFFWFKESKIVIPGVKGRHLFMHVSDIHLHVWDELCSEEEKMSAINRENDWIRGKENFAASSGEPFGDAQKIRSTEAFEKILFLAKELNPEALLISGDTLNYMHPAGERYLKRKLAEYKNNTGRFICVPGNHDNKDLDGIWTTKLSVHEFDGFRIAAVNDTTNTVDDQTLSELESVCNEGVPIIILCHIPLLTEYCKEELIDAGRYFFVDPESADETGKKFVSLAENNSSIKAVVCGHLHKYIYCSLTPEKPQIIGSQGMAGAVDLITVCGD
jgi:Icc-related predicted phosphoesterase